MFAKFINENQIEKAPRCIHVGASTFVMPSAAQYALGGYYEVIEAEELPVKKWFNRVSYYTLVDEGDQSFTDVKTEQRLKEGTDNEWELVPVEESYIVNMKKIVQRWEYEKVEQPDYSELIVGFIREQYSINDELALQRQWDNSPAKKQEFIEYNNYCDDCKERARAEIAEWEAATVEDLNNEVNESPA